MNTQYGHKLRFRGIVFGFHRGRGRYRNRYRKGIGGVDSDPDTDTDSFEKHNLCPYAV